MHGSSVWLSHGFLHAPSKRCVGSGSQSGLFKINVSRAFGCFSTHSRKPSSLSTSEIGSMSEAVGPKPRLIRPLSNQHKGTLEGTDFNGQRKPLCFSSRIVFAEAKTDQATGQHARLLMVQPNQAWLCCLCTAATRQDGFKSGFLNGRWLVFRSVLSYSLRPGQSWGRKEHLPTSHGLLTAWLAVAEPAAQLEEQRSFGYFISEQLKKEIRSQAKVSSGRNARRLRRWRKALSTD